MHPLRTGFASHPEQRPCPRLFSCKHCHLWHRAAFIKIIGSRPGQDLLAYECMCQMLCSLLAKPDYRMASPPPVPWIGKERGGVDQKRKCGGEKSCGLECLQNHCSLLPFPHFCSNPLFPFQAGGRALKASGGVEMGRGIPGHTRALCHPRHAA